MKTKPFISIIIPVRRINSYLLNENFPTTNILSYKRFETIILTSEPSKDEEMLLKKYPWLKIILTEQEMRPAEKRNLGVKKAKGEIIAFIDDDAYPSKHWLTCALSHFQSSMLKKMSLSAVCGPGVLPPKTNLWERMFDEVLKSWIGSGGYSYRFTQQKKRFVDDYPSMNFLIKKNVFKKIGGFNGDYWPGEDSKLCEDVVYQEKGKILYDPKVLIYHHRRNNLRDFLRQHANYGFHRGAFFSHGDRNSLRLSYTVPTFFVFYLFFLLPLLLITDYQLLIIAPLIFYLILMLYLSSKAFINTKNIFISFLSPFVLFLTHITYGIMFVKGFFIGLVKKKHIYL